MKCLRCGQEIDNNIAVCKYCGMDMTQYMRQGQSPQYSQPGMQPGQNQQYVQSGMQQAQAVQAPQYSQPGMQPGQNQQYVQPGMQQPPQYSQWAAQQVSPQYSQQNTAGYYDMDNDADSSENGVKKVRYIPNIINIVGIVMALATLFIPYAHVGSDVRSIYSVFGIVVLPVIIGAVLVCGDVVCACINKTVCHIISMVISVIFGGLYIFEFILSVIDLKKIDASLNAGFNIGAWISLVTAVIMIASVPMWWLLVARKRK